MKKSGFTLAEVLLTLGIIGVVSSLTLPNLNVNTTSAKNKATLKNSMAILATAAQTNMTTNGWNFSGIETRCDIAYNHTADKDYTMCGLLNTNLTGEIMLDGVSDSDDLYKYRNLGEDIMGTSNSHTFYLLSNNSLVGLDAGSTNCRQDNYKTPPNEDSSKFCGGFIDVNGFAGPNKVVQCLDASSTTYSHDTYLKMCEINPNTNADIFPIKYYDSTVELSSNAGISYLYGDGKEK